MDYPQRLVPQPTSRFINRPDANDVLCRWVAPGSELKDAEGHLSVEAVDEEQMFNCSVNILPPSEPDDIYIAFHDTKRFNQKWQPGDEGIMPQLGEFQYVRERTHFYFYVGDIHGHEGKYPFPANKNASKESYNYTFRVRVKHVPLVANIAHFELQFDFVDDKGNAVENAPNNKWLRKLIGFEVRQKLIDSAWFDF